MNIRVKNNSPNAANGAGKKCLAASNEAAIARRRADIKKFFAKRRASNRHIETRHVEMLDCIQLIRDIPGTALKKGMKGTVVEICGTPAESVLVEVSKLRALEDVEASDFIVLNDPAKENRRGT